MMLNPILEKDIRTKMRGWRTPVLMSVYTLLLGFVMFIFFLANNQILNNYHYSGFSPQIAVNAFNTIAIFQFGLLMFIIPTLTATAISGERERQTLDLILCSGISTWSVITGKLLVSIAHIMLLVVVSIPILGMVFLFGGIGFGELLLLFLFYAITALMVASLGVFCSTLFRKNITAIIAAYIGLGILGAGPIVAMFIWGMFHARFNNVELTYSLLASFMFPSPGFGFVSFLSGGGGSLPSLFNELERLADKETSWIRHLKPWMINSLFDMALSAMLIWFSAWKLNPVKKRRREKG
jgi:ABC-2 type transport system permease protein